MTQEEIEAIVIAEYNYWKNVDNSLAISAVGACANIYAAIKGTRAPWHPQLASKHEDAFDEPFDRLKEWTLPCGCGEHKGLRVHCPLHQPSA